MSGGSALVMPVRTSAQKVLSPGGAISRLLHNGKLNNCAPPYPVGASRAELCAHEIGRGPTTGGAYADPMDDPDAVPAPLLAADHPLAAAKYVALTTFRRTGAPVTTPVWFAPSVDEPHLFVVITVDDTGKTKRLAHTSRVELQACDMRGRVAPGTPTWPGSARVVRDPDGIASVRRGVVAKYGFPARFSDLTDAIGSKVRLKRAPRAGILVAVDPAPLADRR